MKNETMTMACIEQPASSSGTSWFAMDSCVTHSDGAFQVFVGGYLVGTFAKGDTAARNLLLVGLSQEPRFSKVALASSFRVTDERVLQIRRKAEREGLASVLSADKRGRPSKVSDGVREELHALFAQGHCAHKAYALCCKGAQLSYWTVKRVYDKWEAAAGQTPSVPAFAVEPLVIEPAQQELALSAVAQMKGATASESDAQPEAEVMVEAAFQETQVEAQTASEPASQDENVIPAAPMRSERHVLNAGCLLLIAMVFSLSLHQAVLSGWKAPEAKRARLRAVLDAIIAALGIGQRCVEGVRRLEHHSGRALLRAGNVPSESGTRLLLREYLDEVGGTDAHLKMTQFYLERARLEEDAPAVFYVDNHMRPYTGKRKLQKGWRMQDKRVRPGTCDYYVHDEDGRPLFRVDVPMHGALGDWLKPIAALLRENLGDKQRILLAFDRGGAFPAHLAPLCERGFEFVTYERGPYPIMPKEAFVETIELEDETLLACEETALLGDRAVEARRIALFTHDARQVNVLAASNLPMQRLVEIITGRWVQENSFKHSNERWGGNQLDCRKGASYAPHHIIVNPTRKRLEQALLIARDREGTVRRHLARTKGTRRDAFKAELTELLAQQEILEAERKTTPQYAYLKDTELADKLVYIDSHYKTLLDTIRIACINAESELADLLRPHLAKPNEAKMVLQNIFKSTGHIRVLDDRIDLSLDFVGNQREKRAAKLFATQLNKLELTLPGDPKNRILRCRFQI